METNRAEIWVGCGSAGGSGAFEAGRAAAIRATAGKPAGPVALVLISAPAKWAPGRVMAGVRSVVPEGAVIGTGAVGGVPGQTDPEGVAVTVVLSPHLSVQTGVGRAASQDALEAVSQVTASDGLAPYFQKNSPVWHRLKREGKAAFGLLFVPEAGGRSALQAGEIRRLLRAFSGCDLPLLVGPAGGGPGDDGVVMTENEIRRGGVLLAMIETRLRFGTGRMRHAASGTSCRAALKRAMIEGRIRRPALVLAFPAFSFRRGGPERNAAPIAAISDLIGDLAPGTPVVGLCRSDAAPGSDREGRTLLALGREMSPAGETALALLKELSQQRSAVKARLALEKRLQQARKAKSLGRMAGAVAHRFNNVLGVVIGNLELAADELPPGHPVNQRLQAAERAAAQAADVSRLMLTCVGQTETRRVDLDLSRFCGDLLPLLRSTLTNGFHLETAFCREPVRAGIDPSHLKEILSHLIRNACEAMGEGSGRVRIATGIVHSDDLAGAHLFPQDQPLQQAAYACVAVSDTGPGIAPGQLPQIFDPFFSTRFTGRGLGLAVTLGLVRRYGGAVAVTSRPGRGARFRVLLPLLTAPAGEREKRCGAHPRRRGIEGAVLLVEDETVLREVAGQMLTRLGYGVTAAAGGREALSLLEAAEERIACVLLDLSMPDMNGWETMDAMTRAGYRLPVILASGYEEAAVMAVRPAHHPVAFLQKPYTLKGLQAALHQAMGACPAPAACIA